MEGEMITKQQNPKPYLNNHSHASPQDIQQALIAVMQQEAQALQNVTENFPANAWQLVERLGTVTGKIVFSGVGKSGLVAQKLAATWSSLSIPSIFMHPTDALHGDLGVIQKNDFFIALSKSGTGSEFEYILPILSSRHIPTALLSCNANGALASRVDVAIALPLTQEACALNLAPTNSSTITMAFGDALAVVISMQKNFAPQDFARNHPAGALGKRLLLCISSLMDKGDQLPLVTATTPFKDLLVTITTKKRGIGIVVDDNRHLLGIITDGDLRRACELGPLVFNKTAADIMTRKPKTVTVETLAYVALEVMEDFNITSLVVVENNVVVGLAHIHDLIKAGIRG